MAEKSISAMFDEDLEDDFLSSWKPANSTHDKGLKVHRVQPAIAKRKSFTSPRLDIDFNFDASFEMPSFDVDLAGLDFASTPPKPKTEVNKNLDDIDDFSASLKGCDSFNLEEPKQRQVDSSAMSAKPVHKSVPRPVSGSVPSIPHTQVCDVRLRNSNLCPTELGVVQLSDETEQSLPGRRDPVLIASRSADNSECPSSGELPGFEAQVQTEPVNNYEGRTFQQHLRQPSREQSTGPLHHLISDKSEDKSTSEAKSVSAPIDEDLKQSEPEGSAHAVHHTRNSKDISTEDPDLSTFKTFKESCLSGGEEAIKIQHGAITHTRPQDLSSAPAQERQTPVSEDVEARKKCLTPRLGDEGNTKREKKHVVDGTLLEDNAVFPGCRDKTGETILAKPDPVSPPVNAAERRVQEEAVADRLDSESDSAFPPTKVVFPGKQTPQTSMQNPSTEEMAKIHEQNRGHLTQNYTTAGSVSTEEASRSPLSFKLNLLSGNSVLKERKVDQELNVAEPRYTVVQFVGRTQTQSHPPEEREQHAKGECTNNGKRKLTDGSKKKEKRQVRFQTTETPMSRVQFQTGEKLSPKGDEKKQRQGKNTNFRAAGFTELSSSRFAFTTATTANAQQSANGDALFETGRLQTGLVAQRTKVHTGTVTSDAVQKTNGLVQLARSKNVRMTRITRDNQFDFGQNQVNQPTLHQKYPLLQFSSKTRAEPVGLDAGTRHSQKNELPVKARAEPEGLKTGTRTPEGDQVQEARDREESTQNVVDGQSLVRTKSFVDVLIKERRDIIEQANQYSDKLDDMMKTLTKLNGDAKDLIVRALVCNNKLLMMQSPRNEEKIQMMKTSILEILSPNRDIMDICETEVQP